jgi:hypothetical protein
VSSYFREIQARNPEINAFIRTDEAQALADAERIQAKMDAGTAGPLAGMVLGIKDVISEKGKITSCASNILRNFEAVYDATVIERLKAADAVLIGRVNMDEFAMGSSNENSIYGPTKNPRDTSRVPGGSSGGSAAAVAAGFCDATLGSDTGNQQRQIPHNGPYCGQLCGVGGAHYQSTGPHRGPPLGDQLGNMGVQRPTVDQQVLQIGSTGVRRAAQEERAFVGPFQERCHGVGPQIGVHGHGIGAVSVKGLTCVHVRRRADVAALGIEDQEDMGCRVTYVFTEPL